MARTLYFDGGGSAVMFSNPMSYPASRDEFARILRERLGNDAEAEFLRIVDRARRDMADQAECSGVPMFR